MFLWPVVHIGNHGDQISNSPDELLVTNQTKGHVPGGGVGERGEGSADRTMCIFKSQEDMPSLPECANCAGLYLLGIYL